MNKILKINILKDFDIESKEIFLNKLNNTVSNDKYQNYIKNNSKPNVKSNSIKKIIQILKDKYKI
jgi:hypothetical protein|tara:strand:- start:378 stop:572 length:195 start_codon:yes stop_codon:yes gene_type:complete